MADHDPLCPWQPYAEEDMNSRWSYGCQCVLIDRVRADEQDTKFAQLDHAEAVAAKLVEIICEQDDLIQIVGVDATNHRAAAADMRRERDAARAEVERLRSPEWEAEVRADERARWGLGWVAAADNVAALAHAEAVSAKLVEVICDDEAVMAWDLKALEATARERDAARAEVESWKRIAQVTQNDLDESASTAVKWYDDLQEARAEVASLREQKPIGTVEWIESGMVPRARAEARAEALADLRAKVEGLDESGDFLYRLAVDHVLALIDEEEVPHG